jgi:Amt family ammonium transporter
MFGAVVTGVFATAAINSYPGLIDGNPRQVLTQIVAVLAVVAYAVVATFGIVKLVDVILGIRISARDEELGIDLATHGEVAYQP